MLADLYPRVPTGGLRRQPGLHAILANAARAATPAKSSRVKHIHASKTLDENAATRNSVANHLGRRHRNRREVTTRPPVCSRFNRAQELWGFSPQAISFVVSPTAADRQQCDVCTLAENAQSATHSYLATVNASYIGNGANSLGGHALNSGERPVAVEFLQQQQLARPMRFNNSRTTERCDAPQPAEHPTLAKPAAAAAGDAEFNLCRQPVRWNRRKPSRHARWHTPSLWCRVIRAKQTVG